MEIESNFVYNSNWKSGLCWGNLAGCFAFYHTLTGLSLIVFNGTLSLISSDYSLIFYSCLILGLIILLLGLLLLPLVFSCILGRRYHIYATIHAYLVFVLNLANLLLVVLVAYEINQLKSVTLLSSRFLLADLALLILTVLIGVIAWITSVGRQFHEPNGQYILQL